MRLASGCQGFIGNRGKDGGVEVRAFVGQWKFTVAWRCWSLDIDGGGASVTVHPLWDSMYHTAEV